MVFLVPWSLANGEVQEVMSQSSNWTLLLGTAAFGGVRILSQFYFLDATSATSLAASNIVIQVGLTATGVVLFDDPVTLCLVLGSGVTFIMSSSFAYLKSTNKAMYISAKGNTHELEEILDTGSRLNLDSAHPKL